MAAQSIFWDRILKPTGPRPAFHTVLLTRFNVRTGASGSDAEMIEWSKRRTDIFERICLPSIVKQERKPARWLIACYDRPEEVGGLRALVAGHPWIEIVPQEQRAGGSFVPVATSFQARSIATMPPEAEYLLTGRTDNDDALGLSYFAVMERYATAVIEQHGHDDFWLSPPHGAQFADGVYRTYMHAMPHFLARCVSRRKFGQLPSVIVSSINHTKVFEEGRVVFSPLTVRPLWLQNVHGENISNAIHAQFPMLAEPECVGSWFGL